MEVEIGRSAGEVMEGKALYWKKKRNIWEGKETKEGRKLKGRTGLEGLGKVGRKEGTGSPKRDARLLKLKIILILHNENREGKIIENIDIKYFNTRASFMGNPVLRRVSSHR